MCVDWVSIICTTLEVTWWIRKAQDGYSTTAYRGQIRRIDALSISGARPWSELLWASLGREISFRAHKASGSLRGVGVRPSVNSETWRIRVTLYDYSAVGLQSSLLSSFTTFSQASRISATPLTSPQASSSFLTSSHSFKASSFLSSERYFSSL